MTHYVDWTTISLILSILILIVVILLLQYKRRLRQLDQETAFLLKAMDNGTDLESILKKRSLKEWQERLFTSRIYFGTGGVITLGAVVAALIYMKEVPMLEVCFWFFFLGLFLLTLGAANYLTYHRRGQK
ncbi:MAG: hypothetical protein J5374_07850 [Bacteroidales bacterium]|nr:hypothetical protein [Bacteroidales bacterium]